MFIVVIDDPRRRTRQLAAAQGPRDCGSRAFAKLYRRGYNTNKIDLEGSRQRSEIVDSPQIGFGEFSPFVEKSPSTILLSILASVSCVGGTVAHTHG